MGIAETRMIALTVRHGPTAGCRTTARATGPTRLSVPLGDFHKEQFVAVTLVHNNNNVCIKESTHTLLDFYILQNTFRKTTCLPFF